MSPVRVPFRKGHGTGNDFVLLPDPEGSLTLTPAAVRALCDRRFGVGGDGVLRAMPADGSAGMWFMDYWNADGSMAEMCGNGARVFARHLVDVGAERPGRFAFATRGGVRHADVPAKGAVSVDMGPARPIGADVAVHLADSTWPGIGVTVPNPHAVAFVDDLTALGDLAGATTTPREAYPDGVNVEFVQVCDPDHVTLRVLERGSGETLSCGTGACAAAWAHRRRSGAGEGAVPVTVTVPGGELVVTERDGSLILSGPAEFVAEGHLDPEWWERVA